MCWFLSNHFGNSFCEERPCGSALLPGQGHSSVWMVPSSWTCLSARDSPSSSAGLSVPVSVCAGRTRAEGMERACPGYGTFPQYTLSGSSCQHNGMSLLSPENTRVCLSGHFKVFCRQTFSVLRGSEQGANMHAVLLLDTSACKQRQHDSFSG